MKKLLILTAAVLALCVLLCACSENSNAAKPLSDVFTQIKSEVTLSDMVEFSDVAELDRFYGIAAEDVDQFAGGINNSGVNQEEIVLIKATGADAAERIRTALSNRYQSKLNETKSYNPEQYAIIEGCSVDADGNYISMILSENAAAIKAIYHAGIGI